MTETTKELPTVAGRAMADLGQQVRALREENARLRQALAFYGDKRSYRRWADDVIAVMEDGGENARAALAGKEAK